MGGVYTDEGLIVADSRHPSGRHFAPLFAYAHLPEHLCRTSRAVAELAQDMVDTLPDGPELAAGLRKLLEAKDCFVRAALGAS